MRTFQIFVAIIIISISIQAVPVQDNYSIRTPSNAALKNAVSEVERQSLLSDRDFVFDFNNTVPNSNSKKKGRVVFASVSQTA